MQKMISAVLLRERVLIFLDMMTGLRRGELAALKWEDIDFLNLQINVSRSVVEQHVGRCKTEISQKPVPIDEYIAADFLEWYRRTPYHAASDWVFATDSNRAGEKRGKQPLWLCKVMCCHRRVKGVKRLGRKMGNWLTRNQAQELVNAASKNSLRGWRDGAMLGLLLGCGLRRSEVVDLDLDQCNRGRVIGSLSIWSGKENGYERYLCRRGAKSFSMHGSGIRERPSNK